MRKRRNVRHALKHLIEPKGGCVPETKLPGSGCIPEVGIPGPGCIPEQDPHEKHRGSRRRLLRKDR